MKTFHDKVWDNYNSLSPINKVSLLKSSINQDLNKHMIKQIVIPKKEQNIAFWDFDRYFGDNDSILNISESEKEYLIHEFGEYAFSQSYLKAKVMIHFYLIR